MKTALKQYILDIQNGTCKGEEYYLELEKKNISEAFTKGNRMEFYDASEESGQQYYNETYTNDK